jgi:8-oxo-dGTP diphosphatase
VTDSTAAALAVVTKGRRVLVVHRPDGMPEWALPGGKIEPGEDAAVAAVRETLEETGVLASAVTVIGGRVHPQTGAMLTYVACRHEGMAPEIPEGALEARWVELGSARLLLPGLFAPAYAYLARVLG